MRRFLSGFRFTCLPALLAVLACGGAQAQEPGAEGAKVRAASEDASEFQRLFAGWKTTLADLHDLQLQYRSASANQQPALRQQFDALMKKSRDQLISLERLAIESVESGQRDPDAMQILALTLQAAFEKDQHKKVLQIVETIGKPSDGVQGLEPYIIAAAYGSNDFERVFEAMPALKAGLDMSHVMEVFQPAEGPEQIRALFEDAREKWKVEQELRAAEAKADNLPRVKLETTKGDIIVELFEDHAPNTVANFITLVKKGFYDGTKFHRVLPHFMAQGGDPQGTGQGGPGYSIPDETTRKDYRNHFGGSLSMAKTSQPDSGGSQFFFTYKPTPGLDGRHTVFGRIIEGYDVLTELKRIDPENATLEEKENADKIVRATVLRDRGHEYTFKTVE